MSVKARRRNCSVDQTDPLQDLNAAACCLTVRVVIVTLNTFSHLFAQAISTYIRGIPTHLPIDTRQLAAEFDTCLPNETLVGVWPLLYPTSIYLLF